MMSTPALQAVPKILLSRENILVGELFTVIFLFHNGRAFRANLGLRGGVEEGLLE